MSPDDAPRGFTIVPNALLRLPQLSRDAKLLYIVLSSYAWQSDQCFPGYDRLQADLQCGRAQIAKYLGELKRAGLIRSQRRGPGQTALYTIVDKFQIETSSSTQNETSRRAQIETSRSFVLALTAVPERNRKKTQRKKDPEQEGRGIPPELRDKIRRIVTRAERQPAPPETVGDTILVWGQVQLELAASMTAGNYAAYIADTRLTALTATTATLAAPDAQTAAWLQAHMARLIAHAFARVTGTPREVRVTRRSRHA